MVYLQNNERYDDILAFDPINRTMESYTRQSLPHPSAEKTDGFYSFLSGRFVALYVEDERLFIAIEEESIEISPLVSVQLKKNGVRRVLVLRDAGRTVATIHYEVHEERGESDITPFASEEDFDFGLYLRNIVAKPKRQRVLLEGD